MLPLDSYDEITCKHATYIIAIYLNNQWYMQCFDTR